MKLINWWRSDNVRCPECASELNSHTVTSESSVRAAKEATICSYCATISVFEIGPGGLFLRPAWRPELDIIVAKPEVQAALAELYAAAADDSIIKVRLRPMDPPDVGETR